jgi:hypothetical protein
MNNFKNWLDTFIDEKELNFRDKNFNSNLSVNENNNNNFNNMINTFKGG